MSVIMKWELMTIYEIVSSSTSDKLVNRATQDSHSISLKLISGNDVKTRSDPSVFVARDGFYY